MKKIFNIVLTILLLTFSFYYTSLVSNYIKEKDPIMLKIKATSSKYSKKPKNAIIKNNTIIPGINGIEVNIEESYSKMKKVNTYNESLLVFNEIKPKLSIDNNLDKIIISGNPSEKNISIILKTNNQDILNTFLELDNENINFILTKNLYDSNYDNLKNLKNNLISDSNSLNSLTDYCYTTNIKGNNTCKDKLMIAPTFITHDYYLNTIKNLENGSLLAYNVITLENVKEINFILNNLKNLGYKIVSLDDLIKE